MFKLGTGWLLLCDLKDIGYSCPPSSSFKIENLSFKSKLLSNNNRSEFIKVKFVKIKH